MDLIPQLMQQFNLSDNGAKGAVGALFQQLGSKLPANDFEQVKSKIPEAQGWMNAAGTPPQSGEGGGLMGAAAGLLGGGGGGMGALAQLAPLFMKHGLSMEALPKFLPVVLQFVQSRLDPSMLQKIAGAVPALAPFMNGGQAGTTAESPLGGIMGKLF